MIAINRQYMFEIGLLQNEEVVYKSSKPIELENNSNRPEKISKKLGKHWVIVTNQRLIFYPIAENKIFRKIENADYFSEKLEDVDYFSYIEKGMFLPKSYIRIWIDLTRLDLLADKLLLKEILSQLKASIQLKLKKGAVIITEINGTVTPIYKFIVECAEKNNVSLGELLANGTISYCVQKEEAEKFWKDSDFLENEHNFNVLDMPDGSLKVILIPKLPLTCEVIKIDHDEGTCQNYTEKVND